MNYKQIVLNSRFETDKQAYFVNEYEKIEKSRNAPKFFPNCIEVIKMLTSDFRKSFEERKVFLSYRMRRAENNEYLIYPSTSPIPFSEINLTQYSTEQNLARYNELKKEFDELNILTFVTKDNIFHSGFSLVELTFIEVELWKAQELIFPIEAKNEGYKSKAVNKQYLDLKEASQTPEHFDSLIKCLKIKKIITETHTLNKRSGNSEQLLYSIVKRFKNDGAFNKIFDTNLHELTNKEFKTKSTHQNWKQAPIYSKSIEK